MKTKAHTKYTLRDGTVVPSVTQVLSETLGWNKQALIAWARREALAGNDPEKLKQKAADIGTIGHRFIECHLKGIELDLKDYAPADVEAAQNCFNAYLAWEKSHVSEIHHSELPLVSEAHNFGGTIDLVATMRSGRLAIVDFKSSKDLWPEHKIQVAAYAELYRENFGIHPDELHLLKLDKETGGFEHLYLGSPRELVAYWLVFKKCLEIWQLRRLIA